ncbi:hypothetical protein EST38_g6891 [Candolleomyces aberdarensis]|uniref:Phosphatidic acid phosphatase type 2/haloperoxidase domain-containing protein n=1 Tax=Candolleomyces aberdarensis TaxID=2316362 RepID=A0A4Q2DIK9_9AGAR|nr:hypothetical protein EST38_g6891 [Candolleomyces aberdarensis]
MQHQADSEPLPGRKKGLHFTISVPPSVASSRAASPAPSDDDNDYFDEKFGPKGERGYDEAPGQHSTDVYDTTLPWWRAAIRRKVVERVRLESQVIAKIQNIVRRPSLDLYFVYTSLAGSHTFFMIMLPAFAFFGHENIARDLVMVLASGVYLSSVLKDLFCAPRPFAPPVVRLTIGSFHLEYGFPSTHATNSVSIALFFFAMAHQLTYTSNILTTQTLTIISAVLVFYTFSIVFGRIYTGMHSFTDCVMGTILGAGIWWGHSDWAGHAVTLSASNPLAVALNSLGVGTLSPNQFVFHVGGGLGAGAWIDKWARTGGWEVPFILIPLCLLAVNQHPQPVDDCPCFEDAIAFGSVVLGAIVGLWGMTKLGAGAGLNGPSIMPGSGWIRDAAGVWMQVERTWGDVALWWGLAALKMGVGILVIFIWRIVAKSALHLVLPPTFRLFAKVFRLPNRRFYTPATEYKNVPSEFHVGEDGTIELHPIPSVIDLPSSAGVIMVETGGIGSGVDGREHANSAGDGGIKMRSVNASSTNGFHAEEKKSSGHANGHERSHSVRFGSSIDEEQDSKDKTVKHYDAEVLTKVIVYAGIAFLACDILPLLFETLGWGLHSSL